MSLTLMLLLSPAAALLLLHPARGTFSPYEQPADILKKDEVTQVHCEFLNPRAFSAALDRIILP